MYRSQRRHATTPRLAKQLEGNHSINNQCQHEMTKALIKIRHMRARLLSFAYILWAYVDITAVDVNNVSIVCVVGAVRPTCCADLVAGPDLYSCISLSSPPPWLTLGRRGVHWGGQHQPCWVTVRTGSDSKANFLNVILDAEQAPLDSLDSQQQ